MKKLIAVLAIVLTLCVSTASAQKYGNGKRTVTPKSSPHSSVTANTPRSPQSSNIGSKPKASSDSYDIAASRDKKRDESQEKFQKYQAQQAPKPPAQPAYTAPPPGRPAYATPNGKTVSIDEKESSYWKGRLDQQKLQTRDNRRQAVFGRYSSRPRVYYDDGIDDDFYWYIRDQSPYVQARWLRDHQYDIDRRRYNDMLTNTAIAAMIVDMNSRNVPQGTHWAPDGIDPDLMYRDHYVQQAVAVQPIVVETSSNSGHFFWSFCKFVFWISFIGVVICVVVYFMTRKIGYTDPVSATPQPKAPPETVNPLKIKKGQYVNLSTLDEQGLQFQVNDILGYTRTLHGNTHQFTDYILDAKPMGGNEIHMRLRMNPTGGKLPGMNEHILKLQLMNEMEFDPDFMKLLTEPDADKKPDDPDFIEYDNDNNVTAQWWRINGVTASYRADVKSDAGTVQQVEYWDFYREVDVPGGKRNEYLFIEVGADDHMIQLWKGVEIDESEVA